MVILPDGADTATSLRRALSPEGSIVYPTFAKARKFLTPLWAWSAPGKPSGFAAVKPSWMSECTLFMATRTSAGYVPKEPMAATTIMSASGTRNRVHAHIGLSHSSSCVSTAHRNKSARGNVKMNASPAAKSTNGASGDKTKKASGTDCISKARTSTRTIMATPAQRAPLMPVCGREQMKPTSAPANEKAKIFPARPKG